MIRHKRPVEIARDRDGACSLLFMFLSPAEFFEKVERACSANIVAGFILVRVPGVFRMQLLRDSHKPCRHLSEAKSPCVIHPTLADLPVTRSRRLRGSLCATMKINIKYCVT